MVASGDLCHRRSRFFHSARHAGPQARSGRPEPWFDSAESWMRADGRGPMRMSLPITVAYPFHQDGQVLIGEVAEASNQFGEQQGPLDDDFSDIAGDLARRG